MKFLKIFTIFAQLSKKQSIGASFALRLCRLKEKNPICQFLLFNDEVGTIYQDKNPLSSLTEKIVFVWKSGILVQTFKFQMP